jgi:hypothetical protein
LIYFKKFIIYKKETGTGGTRLPNTLQNGVVTYYDPSACNLVEPSVTKDFNKQMCIGYATREYFTFCSKIIYLIKHYYHSATAGGRDTCQG